MVLGIVAINQISHVENRLTGKGLAIAGAILGGINTCVLIPLLLLGILLPALGSARRNVQRMGNNTRLRGIHQSCVQYAQGNERKFPGLGDDLDQYGDAGRKTSKRFEILKNNNYFTPDFIISPFAQLHEASTVVTTENFSYAMLQILGTDTPRVNEWPATANSEGAVISDRSRAIDPLMSTTSIHVTGKTTDSTNWRGGVAWNDNHVAFETNGILERTRCRTMSMGTPPGDNIFVDGGNGFMVWN